MPETRDVGRFYAHTLRYPILGAPRFERGVKTVEVEEPYRRGRAVTIRLGRRWAVVVGRWGLPGDQDEDKALQDALRASWLDVDSEEISEWLGGEEEEVA